MATLNDLEISRNFYYRMSHIIINKNPISNKALNSYLR